MPFRNLLLDDEKACVLAVDDTPAILQLLEMALGIDYEVVTAESRGAGAGNLSAAALRPGAA